MQPIRRERDADRVQRKVGRSSQFGVCFLRIGELLREAQAYEDAGGVDEAIALYRHLERHLESGGASEPQHLAYIRLRLGPLYATRTRGDRSDDLRTAIACFLSALEYFTKDHDPRRWATLQMNLATAYADISRLAEFAAEPLRRRAIRAYGNALDVFSAETDFEDWSMAYLNLGTLYAQADDPNEIWTAIAMYRTVISATAAAGHPRARTSASLFLAAAVFRVAAVEPSGTKLAALVAEGVVAAERARNSAQRAGLSLHAAKAAVGLTALHGLLADTCQDARAAQAAIGAARAAVTEYASLGIAREVRNAARLLSTRYFLAEAWSEFLDACAIAIGSAEILYEDAFLCASREEELSALGDQYQRYALGLLRVGRLTEAVEA